MNDQTDQKADYRATIFSQFEVSKEPVRKELDGVPIYVRRLSAGKIEEYQYSLMPEDVSAQTDEKQTVPKALMAAYREKLIAMCITDPEGQLVFSDPQEVAENFPREFIEKVYDLCQEVNGLKIKVEEAQGN